MSSSIYKCKCEMKRRTGFDRLSRTAIIAAGSVTALIVWLLFVFIGYICYSSYYHDALNDTDNDNESEGQILHAKHRIVHHDNDTLSLYESELKRIHNNYNHSRNDQLAYVNNKKSDWGALDTYVGSSIDSSCCFHMFDVDTGYRLHSSQIHNSSIVATPYPPLQPYHQHSLRVNIDPPYIPTLDSLKFTSMLLKYLKNGTDSYATKALPATDIHLKRDCNTEVLKVPNMDRQHTDWERNNLKIHMCDNVTEAFSGAWLATSEYLMELELDNVPLEEDYIHCETASFMMMRSPKRNPLMKGLTVMSLDVLDFSVIHMSVYERNLRRYRHSIFSDEDVDKMKKTDADFPKIKLASNISLINSIGDVLEMKNNPKRRSLVWTEAAKKTIVIMPFLNGETGAGQSIVDNRAKYLRTSFWSFYEFIPNIVIAVTRIEDVVWAQQESSLPFYDIILLDDLPSTAALPVATIIHARKLLLNRKWDFDYVFFSESDHILLTRQLPMLHHYLKLNTAKIAVPHRLLAYPELVIDKIHKKSFKQIEMNKWMTQSCCMKRQNCDEFSIDGNEFQHVSDASIPVVNYYGLPVPLGNGGFYGEFYRPCSLTDYIGSFCP